MRNDLIVELQNRVNDRVISANGISLENVDYTTAVQVLRECGNTVNLLIKRRVLLSTNNNNNNNDLLKVTLTKGKKKDGKNKIRINLF